MRPTSEHHMFPIDKRRTATIFELTRTVYSHRLHIRECHPHAAHNHCVYLLKAALSNVYIFREFTGTGSDLLHMSYYEYIVVKNATFFFSQHSII